MGEGGVFERFQLLASDHDHEYMMITPPSCARISTAPVRGKKNGEQAIGPIPRRIDDQNPCLVDALGKSPNESYRGTGTIWPRGAMIDGAIRPCWRDKVTTPIRWSISSLNGNHPVIPQKANRKSPRIATRRSLQRNLVSAYSTNSKHYRRHRHTIRQTRKNFLPDSARLRYHPAQLKTGPVS